MTAEHFAWSQERAMAYVNLNQPENAISSLTSDLGKHEGTARILNAALLELLVGEYRLAGNEGVRRFITGLAGPHEVETTSASG